MPSVEVAGLEEVIERLKKKRSKCREVYRSEPRYRSTTS